MRERREVSSLQVWSGQRVALIIVAICTEADSRLIETYRKHQQHIEPNGKHHAGSQAKVESERSSLTSRPELKATLQASLQAKVESLEEDKWMFEGDDPLPS